VLSEPVPALFVEDDGPGIAPIDHERVFERFYRVAGTLSEGCGLGLSIVKQIADLHRATVSIRSGAAAGGTRITVSFDDIPAQDPS
jgi:two-component system sensor histidine kinase TctE